MTDIGFFILSQTIRHGLDQWHKADQALTHRDSEAPSDIKLNKCNALLMSCMMLHELR